MNDNACVGWLIQSSFVRIGTKWAVDSEEDLSNKIDNCPFCGSELDMNGCIGESNEKLRKQRDRLYVLSKDVHDAISFQYSDLNEISKKSADKLGAELWEYQKHADD